MLSGLVTAKMSFGRGIRAHYSSFHTCCTVWKSTRASDLFCFTRCAGSCTSQPFSKHTVVLQGSRDSVLGHAVDIRETSLWRTASQTKTFTVSASTSTLVAANLETFGSSDRQLYHADAYLTLSALSARPRADQGTKHSKAASAFHETDHKIRA